MKRLIVFICLLVTSTCCKAQLFNYDYSDNRVRIEPTFENYTLKDKKSGLLEHDGEEFLKKVNPVAPKFLSKEVIEHLAQKRRDFIINLFISPIGDVLYVKFNIRKELWDQNLITEEQLKGMYDCYKQIKLKVRKFNPKEDFDFCQIMGLTYVP